MLKDVKTSLSVNFDLLISSKLFIFLNICNTLLKSVINQSKK
jgi:hypothetical protein